jgi:thiosulfate dehydrogenase [quinone] large subunit
MSSRRGAHRLLAQLAADVEVTLIADRARRWLAFFRIYIGGVWFAYGISKIEPQWAAPDGQFYQATEYAVGTITGPMHDFIVNVVLPHQHTFALLVAYGETLVGISLILGAFTQVGFIGGMFLSANYFLAQGKYQVSFGIESLELLLFVCCAILLGSHAGDFFSLDRVLFKKRHRSTEGANDRRPRE